MLPGRQECRARMNFNGISEEKHFHHPERDDVKQPDREEDTIFGVFGLFSCQPYLPNYFSGRCFGDLDKFSVG